jgi:hypothetical protein
MDVLTTFQGSERRGTSQTAYVTPPIRMIGVSLRAGRWLGLRRSAGSVSRIKLAFVESDALSGMGAA